VPGALKTCTASTDPCKVNVCDPATGDCVTQNAPNGTTCEDGNLCTTGETCQEGVCQGGTAVANCCQSTSDCPTPANQCLRATCISNVCGVENKPDNTACDDNLGCTRGETCLAGICQGGTSTCTGTNNFCCGAGTSRAGNCRQAPGTVCTQNNQCCNSCTGSRTTPGVCT
jgi:hypothetical protein